MQQQHLLFDLDGTLTDSAPGILNGVRYALQALGIPVRDERELYEFVGPPLEYSFREYCGLSGEANREAIFKYREYYHDKGVFENKVYSGMDRLLSELRNDGKKLYVATSKPEGMARRVLDHFGLTPYFTFIAGSEPEGSRASKTAVIRWVLEQNRIAPQDAVMIGDRRYDIIGAREAGVASVGVLYGYGSRGELEEAGARFIAEDLPALLALLRQREGA